MTALKEYARLEATGLWRPDPDGQRREVVISFGEATLVISDTAGRALTHWSLPAVERLNPGQRPAIYSPDSDATETLEVEEDLMIGAIERVRRALAKSRPRPGRVRNAGIAAAAALMLGLGVFWMPSALIRQTLSVVPMAKRSEIGASLLGHLQREVGTTCRNPLGTNALAVLRARLLGAEASGQVVVLPDGPDWPIVLPGRIIVLTRKMIEDPEDPSVVAGAILSVALSGGTEDPLAPVLRRSGLWTTLTLLTTGDVPAATLQDYAAELLERPPALAPESELRQGFAAAGVPFGPWARSVDPDSDLYGPAPATAVQRPVLSDGDWISLQGICRT